MHLWRTSQPDRRRPVATVAVLALSAAAVMLAWNLVLPGLVEIPALGYWQALGLLLLARLLVGDLRAGGRRWPLPEPHPRPGGSDRGC